MMSRDDAPPALRGIAGPARPLSGMHSDECEFRIGRGHQLKRPSALCGPELQLRDRGALALFLKETKHFSASSTYSEVRRVVEVCAPLRLSPDDPFKAFNRPLSISSLRRMTMAQGVNQKGERW